MSETGDRLRDLFTEIAPPVDLERIVHTTEVPARTRRDWVVAVAATVVVLVGGAASYLVFGGSDGPAEVADGSPATVTTYSDTIPPSTSGESTSTVPENGFVPQVMQPLRIECSSELPDYPCAALVDGDEMTRWNAVEGGVGAEIRMVYDRPVQIVSIDLVNPGDEETFTRNARIRGMEILVDDEVEVTVVELEETGVTQTFSLETRLTSIVTFRVTSAYPAQSYQDLEPFAELALAEIRVWGREAPETNIPEGQPTNEGTVNPIVELTPTSVECTTELASFPCSGLFDDDPTTVWYAPEGGIGAEITLTFDSPVQIVDLFLLNVEDPERFARNARIRGLEIVRGDTGEIITTEYLEDTNEPQRVTLRSLTTTSLILRVTGAYPGLQYEGREPFFELTLAEIVVFGRPSPPD